MMRLLKRVGRKWSVQATWAWASCGFDLFLHEGYAGIGIGPLFVEIYSIKGMEWAEKI